MYIERILENDVRKYLARKEIVAVVGPRQCGKTTLLKQIFRGLEGAAFLDFEDRDALELFTEDVKGFAEVYVKPNRYLFIDEFQYAKDGGKQLKYLYDHYTTKILISGSSVSGMAIQGLQYLVGRVLVFSLYPFSFAEFLSFRDPALFRLYRQKMISVPVAGRLRQLFEEFCIYGGYPAVVLASTHKDKELLLKNIYNTYLLKEIREILQLPDDDKLARLIQALALQTGGLVNYNELSTVSGFPYKELIRHLNVLEKTFIAFRARPFYTNKRVELVKAPKVYFYDSGFRNIVLKNFQPIGSRPDKGDLYENAVASELLKKGYEIKFWRTKAQAEVDFVVEKNGRIVPVEVKTGLSAPKVSRSLAAFLEKYRPERAVVLSEECTGTKKKVQFRPAFLTAETV